MSDLKRELLTHLIKQCFESPTRPIETRPTATVRDIAEQTGYSDRHVWRAVERFGTEGAIVTRTPHDLTDEEAEAIATSRGNVGVAHKVLVRELGAAHVPSQSTLRRAAEREFGRDTLARFKSGAQGHRGTRIYLRAADLGRNQQWQTDHAHLPLRVRIDDGSIVNVWITTIVDAGTRMLMSHSLTWNAANTDSIREAVVSAVMGQHSPFPGEARIGGIPELILYDRGADFLSDAMQEHYDALTMIGLALPPYSPHRKGKVERLYRTLKSECIDQLPGLTRGPKRLNGDTYNEGEVIDFDDLAGEIADYFFHYNFERIHSELGVSPYQAWQDDPRPLRSAPPDVLVGLMDTERRKVTTKGISLLGAHYKADVLATLSGAHVDVRFLPWDLRSVEVFRENRHIGTAIHEDLMTARERQDLLKQRQTRESAGRARARALVKRGRRLSNVSASPVATGSDQDAHTREQRIAAAQRVLHRTAPAKPTQQTLVGL